MCAQSVANGLYFMSMLRFSWGIKCRGESSAACKFCSVDYAMMRTWSGGAKVEILHDGHEMTAKLLACFCYLLEFSQV